MAMKTGYDCLVRTSLATFFKSFMNAAILRLPGSIIGRAEDRRRMYGCCRVRCEFRIDELSSLGVYGNSLTKECLRGRRSEA